MLPPRTRTRLARLGVGLALGAAGALVVRATWVSDDAFISLRTAEAFLRGDGLVWNPGERVQAYTHPLWLAVLIALRAIARDAYVAAAAAGVLVTGLGLAGLVRLSRGHTRAAAVVLAYAACKPLVHFSTSGLENPLSHALIAATALAASSSRDVRHLRLVGALVALGILTRVDLGVLMAPIAVWVLATTRGAPAAKARALLPAAALVLAWEAFSLLYYGSLVPNTALAKLGTGLSAPERVRQGLEYLATSVRWDPWTAVLIVGGVGAGLATRDPRSRAWGLGALAYVGYVVWIGGDFMAGRFLTPPAFAALVILSRVPFPRPARLWLAAAAAITAAVITSLVRPPWDLELRRGRGYARAGVVDEQAFYSADSALFWEGHDPEPRWPDAPPRHGRVRMGREMEPGEIDVHGMVGFYGYGAADEGIIIDPMGLTDPLLARLPAIRTQEWRPGHHERLVPEGYVATVRTGVCRMRDPALCALWEHVHRVAHGPLLDPARLHSIWVLTTGGAPVDRDRYARPRATRVGLEAVAAARPTFSDQGALVDLGDLPLGPRCVRVRLERGAPYSISVRDAEGDVRCAEDVDLTDALERSVEVELSCDGGDELLVEPRARPRVRTLHHLDAIRVDPGAC